MGHNDGKDLAMPIEGESTLPLINDSDVWYDVTFFSRVREYAHNGVELYPEDGRHFPHHSICEQPLLSGFLSDTLILLACLVLVEAS